MLEKIKQLLSDRGIKTSISSKKLLVNKNSKNLLVLELVKKNKYFIATIGIYNQQYNYLLKRENDVLPIIEGFYDRAK